MIRIAIAAACLLVLSSPAQSVEITSIEQLDELAEFSFAIMSDIRGSTGDPVPKVVQWIAETSEFVIGNGDLFNGSNDQFQTVMGDPDNWFHTKLYPVVGDHDNEIQQNYDPETMNLSGGRGSERLWGYGSVMFEMVDGFFTRSNIQWRQPENSTVRSCDGGGGSCNDYEDKLVDYYAYESVGKFTVHMIAIHKGDENSFAPRSADFLMDKVKELEAAKTPYDIIVLLGHDERWFSRSLTDWDVWNGTEIDYLLETADLIVDASDHRFRRQHAFDNRGVDGPALEVNSGAACCAGISGGYLDIHVFDNPPRFTVQYIVAQDRGQRGLHIGSNLNYVVLANRGETETLVNPMLKYIDGEIVQPVDWGNFEINTVAAPAFDAEIISQNIPQTLGLGQKVTVQVTVKNTGSEAWTADGNIHLTNLSLTDWQAGAGTVLEGSVAPGAETTLEFDVTAPADQGHYDFHWSLASGSESARFGTPGEVTSVFVDAALHVKMVLQENQRSVTFQGVRGYYRLSLYNVNGTRVFSVNVSLEDGYNTVAIAKQSLAEGVYFLNISPFK